MARKALFISLTLLGLFLLGTVIVLSTVQVYFGVDERDLITPEEVAYLESNPSLPYGTNLTRSPSGESWTGSVPVEKIPRIIHQTWKDDTLPERWIGVRDKCLEMHPDYEYMLWTDASSREFIAQHYAWFLDSFDSYPYPIQRADAIRYFVLHRFGGVYLDLDVGCKRPLRPLLQYDVILPRTIPVGVSNDIMFASPRHPFMELVIHNLVTFNHNYVSNYPTVMFSTGPMFLSAQYGLWPSIDGDRGGVRVLPKSLYGKNAKEEEAQHAFFWHYYGSSWHADDAGFITFLGKFGMLLMYGGSIVLVAGAARLLWSKGKALVQSPETGPIFLPFSMPPGTPVTGGLSRPATPSASRPNSPMPPHGSRRASSVPGSSGAAKDRGVLYWMPYWMPSDGSQSPYPRPPTPPTASGSNPSENGWASYLPSFAYDPQANRYHPVPYYSRPSSPDSDAVSLHSLHTIRASKSRRHNRFASTTSNDLYSSEDDLEAGGIVPLRKPKALRPHSISKESRQASGLPPSYTNWSNWAVSLLRGSSKSTSPPPSAASARAARGLLSEASDSGSETPAVVTSPRRVSAPPMSRTSSAASISRTGSPMPPPGYSTDDSEAEVGSNVDEEVDRLLSSMKPDVEASKGGK